MRCSTVATDTMRNCGLYYRKGPSMKDVRSQGEGACPVRTFCAHGVRGSSDADVRTFWCKKLVW